MLPDTFTADHFRDYFKVSRETIARLMIYETLLRKWQTHINLVGNTTLNSFWHRHIADSAQIVTLAPATAQNWLDLGSGAGFPGLVFAILFAEDPHKHVTLVESDGRKTTFLQNVLRETNVKAHIINDRIEAAAPKINQKCGVPDIITARALAPLTPLFSLMRVYVAPHTIALLHKGKNWVKEVEEAQKKWRFVVENHISITDKAARILQITELAERNI